MFHKEMFTAAGMVALSTGLSIGIAYASPPTKVDLGSTRTMFTTCTGENITFTGTNTMSVAVAVQNGIVHLHINESFHDKGIGQNSGNDYVLNAEATEEQNGKLVNSTGEFNFIDNVQIIGKGPVPNESFKVSTHPHHRECQRDFYGQQI